MLSKAVLYISTEPCVMCSGAIYWAGINKVVFGCSAIALSKIAGGDFLIPCREVFSRGDRKIEVVGPALEEEAKKVHEGFW